MIFQLAGGKNRRVSLTALVFIIESALIATALLWMFIRKIPVIGRIRICPFALGAGALLGLAILASSGIFYLIDRYLFNSRIRRMLETGVYRIFEGLTFFEILFIAVMSGFAEELFFRGVLLAETGIVVSSLIFGILHTSGRKAWFLGLWTALIGAVFAFSYIITGNLFIPMVAHILNNFIAIMYVRYVHLPSLASEENKETVSGPDSPEKAEPGEISLKDEALEVIGESIESRLKDVKEDIKEIIEEAADFVKEVKEEFLPEDSAPAPDNSGDEPVRSASPVKLLDPTGPVIAGNDEKVAPPRLSVPEPSYDELSIDDEEPPKGIIDILKDTGSLIGSRLKGKKPQAIPRERKAPDTDDEGIGTVDEPM